MNKDSPTMQLLKSIIFHAPKRLASILFPKTISDLFHILYYYNSKRTWGNTFYKGIGICKYVGDLQIYHEIIQETKPTVIIETGTCYGGSALFFADQLKLLDIPTKYVISIDIQDQNRMPKHEKVIYLRGSSTSEYVILKIQELITKDDRIMVVLDSDHTESHVYSELLIYSKLVTPGCFMVVEDTNVGTTVLPLNSSPLNAVKRFLIKNNYFKIDTFKNKYFVSFNTWIK